MSAPFVRASVDSCARRLTPEKEYFGVIIRSLETACYAPAGHDYKERSRALCQFIRWQVVVMSGSGPERRVLCNSKMTGVGSGADIAPMSPKRRS
jgi:hypothetical protein